MIQAEFWGGPMDGRVEQIETPVPVKRFKLKSLGEPVEHLVCKYRRMGNHLGPIVTYLYEGTYGHRPGS